MRKKKIFNTEINLSGLDDVDPYENDITKMFRWMKELKLPKKPVIFDVGANIGVFTLAYASIFKDSQIHSFEPVPHLYDNLVNNIRINRHLSAKITAHNVGMSNQNETKQLSIPTSSQHERYKNNTDMRLYSIFGKGAEKISSTFIPLDTWVIENDISSLDFIKIDVEGYELPVLQGASKTLRSQRPVVIFELNQLTIALSATSIDEYLRFGIEHGYRVYGLEYGFKQTLLKIDIADQVSLVSDLILVPV